MKTKSNRPPSHFLLLLIVIAVSILSCTFTDKLVNSAVALRATASPSQFQWETFTDPADGFSIEYPSTWFYYRSESGNNNASQGVFVLFSSALGNTDIQTRTEDEEARLVVNTLPNSASTSVESWLADSPLLELDATRLSVNGIQAIRVEISPENAVDHSTHTFLFLATSTRLYSLIGVVASSPHAARWQEVILKMQSTLKANP